MSKIRLSIFLFLLALAANAFAYTRMVMLEDYTSST